MLKRLFRRQDDRAPLRPLYAAIVAEARRPDWYRQGAVPDTLDGRFDMVAAILSLALIRLEALGARGIAAASLLTEIFVEDMDGQLREQGVGDVVVGKHVGRMMSALGGRLASYRAALKGEESLADVLTRNLFRSDAPPASALAWTEQTLRERHRTIDGCSLDALLDGRLTA